MPDKLAISARLIKEEAERRGWQVTALQEDFLHTLAITPPSGRIYYFDSCQPPLTSAAAMVIADNKLATYLIAQKLNIPVAHFAMYQPETAADFLAKHGDIVVKPIDTNHGDGITVGITTKTQLDEAVAYAQEYSSRIVLQSRATGEDSRVIVVDGKVVAAASRVPAHVVGDGKHTVEELIGLKNNDPARQQKHRGALSTIDLTAARRYMGERINSVPAANETVPVLAVSNISMGGQAKDVTDVIHPSYKDAAVTIATALDMFLCGVDFLAPDITKPLVPGAGVLLEINATPGLRMHHYPAYGKSHDVAGAILDAFSVKIAGTNT